MEHLTSSHCDCLIRLSVSQNLWGARTKYSWLFYPKEFQRFTAWYLIINCIQFALRPTPTPTRCPWSPPGFFLGPQRRRRRRRSSTDGSFASTFSVTRKKQMTAHICKRWLTTKDIREQLHVTKRLIRNTRNLIKAQWNIVFWVLALASPLRLVVPQI